VKRDMRKFLLFVFLIALMPFNMASQTPAPGQTPDNEVQKGGNQGFTLKTSTEIILVNVVVKDKDDKFVKDLKTSDFTITEDGKKVDIISIDTEDTDAVAVSAETPKADLLTKLNTPAAAKPNAAEVATLSENDLKDRRLIVLFFDLSSLQPEEVERAAKSGLDYVNKSMAPADLVSVVTFSNALNVDLDFTADKEELTAVLNAMATGSNEGLANGADATTGTADDSTDAAAGFTADETEYNVFNTDKRLQALTDLANDLALVQQKKSVLYFSGGIQRTGIENQTQLRQSVAAARHANLSFYTVDVRGLEALAPGGSATGGGGRGGAGGRGGGSGAYSGAGVQSAYNSNFSSQETLATLANDTGGKAFLDNNDFAPAFTKVHDDTSFYYLLSYTSTNPAQDGKYRKIQVRVNRPDLRNAKLEYRNGYYAKSDFQHSTKETREAQLQEQLQSDVPSSDFPVYISTGYFRINDRQFYVPVSVVVPGAQIPFTRASDKDKATLDFMALMRDDQKRPYGTLRQTVNVEPGTAQDVKNKNVQYDTGFQLPPGKYDLKLVVRENQTGRIGSFEAEIIIPELKNDPVKLSSVVVSNQKQAVKTTLKNNPLISNGNEIVPNVTHVFSSGQNMYFYYEVYDPAREEKDSSNKNAIRLLSSVVFYKNNVKAFETPLVQADEVNVPDRKATAFELQVPLAQLKPGFYTAQINVVDDAAGKFAFPRIALMVRGADAPKKN
jgi:VWFA-related protein